MAYVNVVEWSTDQIGEWLKGLDSVILQYIPRFLEAKVEGHQLLNLRPDDLENLGVFAIGHQEIILEAVGQLRNFHYELDRENLQYLALKLSSAATSLYNELKYYEDTSKVETQTLSDVTSVIATVKPLAFWLDRSPFGQPEYTEKKTELLQLSIEMATSAQRDRFAENPLLAIRDSCKQLASLADYIIQDISDPLILQPATLDLATLKKREQELGFDILPNTNGIHQVIDIKFGSPAHSSGKIEDGDEIVQVNYQTVVGWQPTEVVVLCLESPADVLLTLKKRPRHTHTYGQIYMKPYRLPSRKRSMPYNRWGSLPSPRPDLLTIRDFEMPLPRAVPVPVPPPILDDMEVDSSSEESESSRPGSPSSDHISSQHRIFLPKPRSVVQRRNTTSGSSPVSKRPNISIEQFWLELKNHKSLQHSGSAQMSRTNDDDISDSLYRRDKAVSYSAGLELSPRPKTCIGVNLNPSKVVKLKEKLNTGTDEKASPKTVKFHEDLVSNISDHKTNEDTTGKESKERGRLDKSHSTPAYDFGESEDESFPIMREVIPESPTSSIDSPSIVVHSPEKIDQILGFKKSSHQIGGAMNHHNRDKYKGNGEVNDNIRIENMFGERILTKESNIDKGGQILETINIAVLEHRKREELISKKTTCNGQNIFQTEFGESNSMKPYDSAMSEQILTIQNELLEAINEQRKISAEKSPGFNVLPKPDVPPEPPPRPLSTQKPGYIPPKPFNLKNIQKEDIRVIPNTSITPPVTYARNDIPLPVSGMSVSPGTSPEIKFSVSSEGSSTRTPLMPARSLQVLETDIKGSVSNLTTNKLDSSVTSLKASESAKLSVSPANSMVRGLLSAGKSKSLKKKNSILAKRRKISVKELGSCDMEGFLYQRCRKKNNPNVSWHLRWFILMGNTFYGFKYRDSSKADCLIFLSGFTVSPAQEVKSKQFAFKIYHTGTVFYFASDSAEATAAWVESITRATLTNNDSWERASKKDKKTDESKHFSETDYSDDDDQGAVSPNEKSKADKQEKAEKSHKFGSLKKFTNRMHKSDSQENVNHSSTSLDRKYFNRFFSSKSSKNKEEKSKLKNSDVPVPTDRYRSYRKIPLSSSSSSELSLTRGNLDFVPVSQIVHDETKENKLQDIAKVKKIECIDQEKHIVEDDNLPDLTQKHQKKANPINFIHASNPNLLDFEKSDFVSKPKCAPPFLKSIVQRPDNFIGFVTLEQFMLNKQEEERRQVYSNRVLMGVERDTRADEKNNQLRKQERTIRDNNNLQKQLDKIVPDVIYGEIPKFLEKNIPPSKMEQIQNRSLPKTPLKPAKPSTDSTSSLNVANKTNDNKLNLSQPLGKKKNDGYEIIKYDDIILQVSDPKYLQDIKIDNNSDNPPLVPKKPSFHTFKDGYEKIKYNTDLNTTKEPSQVLFEIKPYEYKATKNAKDLGYEFIYGDDNPAQVMSADIRKPSNKSDLGYETVYGEDQNKTAGDEPKPASRKLPIELRKPAPPPKTSTKTRQPVSRQGSSTSIGDRKSSGIDTKPVFKQGDCPEKFWLDSLRRHDKVYTSKVNDFPSKVDKFYTKHSEPSAYMKSSEATIVKSDKLQNKVPSGDSSCVITAVEHKPLKSATQYTPMSMQLVSPNKGLKTSPQFELSLNTRDPPTTMFRLRQMFQHGPPKAAAAPPGPAKKTLLGSPRLHRVFFHRHAPSPADEWAQDFVYSKGTPSTSYSDISTESYGFPSSTGPPFPAAEPPLQKTPEYLHLDYPPVFEPETYTLTDPSPSSLRKLKHDIEKK